MRKKLLALTIVLSLCVFALLFYFFSQRNRHPHELILYGNVDVRQVDIGFRVPGKVTELFFQEGDLVAPGALMATLDRTPYDSEVSQNLFQLKSIQAGLKNADILLQRRQELIGVGAVSQEEVDNALATRDALACDFRAAQAALQIAIDHLEYTKVYAPSEGIILSRVREPGSVVSPSDPIYLLSVSSPVWIRAYIGEPDLGRVAYGMEATVKTDTGASYQGKIGFISPVAEFTPKTVETTSLRTDLVYRLRIYIETPDNYLKQGMPVTVHLKLSGHE